MPAPENKQTFNETIDQLAFNLRFNLDTEWMPDTLDKYLKHWQNEVKEKYLVVLHLIQQAMEKESLSQQHLNKLMYHIDDFFSCIANVGYGQTMYTFQGNREYLGYYLKDKDFNDQIRKLNENETVQSLREYGDSCKQLLSFEKIKGELKRDNDQNNMTVGQKSSQLTTQYKKNRRKLDRTAVKFGFSLVSCFFLLVTIPLAVHYGLKMDKQEEKVKKLKQQSQALESLVPKYGDMTLKDLDSTMVPAREAINDAANTVIKTLQPDNKSKSQLK